MKTPIQKIIDRDIIRLQRLKEIYDSENPIFIKGFKEEVNAKIEEVATTIIQNEMLLDEERQSYIDFAESVNADGHDLGKMFDRNFQTL